MAAGMQQGGSSSTCWFVWLLLAHAAGQLQQLDTLSHLPSALQSGLQSTRSYMPRSACTCQVYELSCLHCARAAEFRMQLLQLILKQQG